MSTSSSYDVAVIGAGVFGAWTALCLRRSGKSVILIDQYGPGNSRSSSGGESRIIRMGYGADSIYTRSAQQSLQRWLEFAELTKEPLFERTSVLWLARDDDPYSKASAKTLAEIGIPFERLSASELSSRYPQLALDQIEWALLEPDSGALLARRAVQSVVRQCIAEGVRYRQHCVTFPGDSNEIIEVTTVRGDKIAAGSFVFACGPWLPKLFPELLGNRIQPSRQEVFFFGLTSNAALHSKPALPIWVDFKDEAYGFPDLENRGVKIAIDRHGPPIDPDRDDRIVSSIGLAEVRRYVTKRLPGLKDAPVVETRVCQYENTSNGDFLIDRHPNHANVWLVGGGSGHGFKHGPTVGAYVTARLAGSDEGIEPRFSLSSKGTSHQREVF